MAGRAFDRKGKPATGRRASMTIATVALAAAVVVYMFWNAPPRHPRCQLEGHQHRRRDRSHEYDQARSIAHSRGPAGERSSEFCSWKHRPVPDGEFAAHRDGALSSSGDSVGRAVAAPVVPGCGRRRCRHVAAPHPRGRGAGGGRLFCSTVAIPRSGGHMERNVSAIMLVMAPPLTRGRRERREPLAAAERALPRGASGCGIGGKVADLAGQMGDGAFQ